MFLCVACDRMILNVCDRLYLLDCCIWLFVYLNFSRVLLTLGLFEFCLC